MRIAYLQEKAFSHRGNYNERSEQINPPYYQLAKFGVTFDGLVGPGTRGASLGIMRHCFFHGGGGQELPASFDRDKAESFGQVFPADAAGAHRPGFPDHGKTEREMSKRWSKFPSMNMTPIFATKQ
jgi:hypothetical protein